VLADEVFHNFGAAIEKDLSSKQVEIWRIFDTIETHDLKLRPS